VNKTEFIAQIGKSEYCLTYETNKNTLYCRVYTTNDDQPLGAVLAKKKLTQTSISTLTPRSHIFTQFKRVLKGHSMILKYFQDMGVAETAYMTKVEEALDKLQIQYDDEMDKLNEKHELELEALEEQMKVEAEQKYSEYLELLEHLNMTPIEHLVNLSSWFAAKESMNITAGVLGVTSTLWGFLPIWIQIIGAAGSGKSKIEESILAMIPGSNVIYGESSLPALYSQAEMDSYFFDRKILALGDMGSERDLERNEDLFNIGKRLYSDKAGATRRKMEKLDKNGPNEMVLEEIKGHCSILFTTVHELTDAQHVSRTISLNPLDDMKVFDEYSRHMSTLTPANMARREILKEADLLKGMIYHCGEIYRELEFDLINPYYESIIKWTNRLPEPKRAREQINALLQVIVLFNNNPKQKYELSDGRVIFVVSMNDVLLFEKLFRVNVGVSVEAMNFYTWMKSKNRKGQVRVTSMDEDEWDEVTLTNEPTFDPTWRSLFTINSIRGKVNANQRSFDKKKIGEYVDQLIDVGLVVVKANDSQSPRHDRIMGFDPINEYVSSGGMVFDRGDVDEYLEKYAGCHVWLDEVGREWLNNFVYFDMNQVSEVVEKRIIPWEGVV
jgi:hypothetical protein